MDSGSRDSLESGAAHQGALEGALTTGEDALGRRAFHKFYHGRR